MRFRIVITLAYLALVVNSADIVVCDVCGEGLEVGSPDAVFTFPGQPAVQCGLLQDAGEGGQITPDQCSFLPGLIDEACACQAIAPGAAPTIAPFAPALDTIAPFASPTMFT
jgi:hypothetical protein